MNWYCLVIGWMFFALVLSAAPVWSAELYVAVDGSDANPGTKAMPLATIAKARDAAGAVKSVEPVTVYVRGGTYELAEPVVFTSADSGSAEAPVSYRAYPGETVVISGGRKLDLQWKPWRDGIMQAKVHADMHIDQLFIDGKRQHLARWPNHTLDERGVDVGYSRGLRPVQGEAFSKVTPALSGYPAFVLDTKQFTEKKWANPDLAVIHVFQSRYWANMQWRIRSIDYATRTIALGEGGWQVGTLWWEKRANFVAPNSKFYVENALEELDAPGEWYHDAKGGVLYYKPAEGVNPAKAQVVACGIKQLFIFKGSLKKPVRHVSIQGMTFTHTGRTILDVYEDRLRGDWSIARQAAVKLEGTEDCTIHDCTFTGLGGNAVFLSNYNRRATVSDSLFHDVGDSAVAIVGSDDAVRSLEVHEKLYVPLTEIDTEIGPKTPDYPGDCKIHNNLMYDLGVFGKQVAGVYLSACKDITVSHNTICRIPRAGICINDGCWGGHIIEFNDISMTVRETSDHGPLNAWGRDRYWQSLHREGKQCDMSLSKKYALLDNHQRTHIRNNRFAHPTNNPAQWVAGSDYKAPGSFSWGIDLDDGSSNYHVYNNLCLGMSIKLREGYYRTVQNNVFVGPYPPNKHACFKNSNDIYIHNIYVNTKDGYAWSRGPATRDLPAQMDHNVYFNYTGDKPIFGVDRSIDRARRLTWEQWQAKGMDTHSVFADPMFIDPAKGDYRVKADSPALELGFKNFPMDRFGTRKKLFQSIIKQLTVK